MEKTGLSPGDPDSFSRPDEVSVEHIQLLLDVNFEQKILSGKAILTVEKHVDSVNHVILDSRDLKIKNVISLASNKSLDFSVSPPVGTFGSKLKIQLPEVMSKKCLLSISYECSEKSTALQWLTAEQTAGKTHPYMFSHCEAIHCRAMVPCQDTPSVKATYTAEITAPAELVVLMSAPREGEPVLDDSGKKKLFKFNQKVPIPSYLIAIAVGHLESRKIGPRSHVWSEKEYVDKAAYEFAETEKMLSTAEEICGPYVWGIYDLLVLPPSFPYGGMENPCLTFVTPTVLAGDRSLADVVAHEIAHSWTGNLVTNKNFEHFWLNEGFTMFVERKILSKMYGNLHRHFSAIGGLKELADTIKARGENDMLTCLVPDLRGIDPDDSFSVAPYEKGHTFLFYLEELVGGPDVFDPFLRSYLDKYKYKSLETNDFKNYLLEYFPNHPQLKTVDWNLWLHTPGMPPIIPKYDATLATVCTDLCKRWHSWSENEQCPFKLEDIAQMSSLQVKEFLVELLEGEPLSLKKVQTLGKVYNLDSQSNSEIRCRWLRLCIKAKWTEKIADALAFATEQGRMKFVRPIFRDLYNWEEARETAIKRYKEHKPRMMYVAAYTVGKDLHLES